MVDTQLLEEWIKETGKPKTFLAKKCGCSVQSLRLKIKNKYDFTTTEVEKLCNELNITRLTDKEKIFFAK